MIDKYANLKAWLHWQNIHYSKHDLDSAFVDDINALFADLAQANETIAALRNALEEKENVG